MKESLLIVSGNASERSALLRVFSGLETVSLLPSAADYDAAVHTLHEQKTDVLLFDMLLPGGDGLMLLDAVAALSEQRRPASFLMTAMTDERLLCAIQDQIVFCFAKPIVPERVALRVLQLMRSEPSERCGSRAEYALDAAITAAIRAIGIPANLSGYYYLRDAIRLYARSDMPLKLRITTDVYPRIAKAYDTTAMVVENAMRTAIESAWVHGNLGEIHKYFGYTVNDKNGKPGNAEFVMLMAEHVRITPVRGCK